MSESPPGARPNAWKWLVCGLLLLATMLNYMDRLTLNTLAKRIMDPVQGLGFEEDGYGLLELGFGLGFAAGALIFGFLADRINVYYLYPFAVLAWSIAGFFTGFAQGFLSLLLWRSLLGAMEAGNWPCALRTTQRILPPEQRTLGNSLLQSGAAFGAVLAPLIILGVLEFYDSWRPPFWAIGVMGLVWVAVWLAYVRPQDLALPPRQAQAPGKWFDGDRPSSLQVRRFIVLIVLVISINITWHFFRAWMSLFLQNARGYTEKEATLFLSAYNIAADVGTLSAGALTLVLIRKGIAIHRSRLLVFFLYALLAALSLLAAFQPKGPFLLVLLLIIGFGSLGLFPVYYSFSQELTTRHQGKVTGTLGCINWIAIALLQGGVGVYVKQTKSYQLGVALAGLAPLFGLMVALLLWGPTEPTRDVKASNVT